MRQILITVLILVAAVVVMFGLSDKDEKQHPKPAQQRDVVANTAIIHKSELGVRVRAWGRVRSQADIELLAEAEGTVEAAEHAFLPGTVFEAGDLLLRIDNRRVRLALKSARSKALSAAAAALPELQFDVPTSAPLLAQWMDTVDLDSSIPDLPAAQDSKTRLLYSRFNLYTLWNTAKDLEITLEKHELRAPFRCTVLRADLRPGATARKGSPVGRLLNLDALEVEVEVPGSELHFVEVGAPVTIKSPGNPNPLSGVVSRIGKQVDASTRTIPVFVRVTDHRNQLLEGVFVEAQFLGRTLKNVVRLPGHVLGKNNSVPLLKNGVLSRATVTVVHTEDDSILVTEGLSDGDTLIVDVLQGVALGTRIRDSKAPAKELQPQGWRGGSH